MAILKIHTYPEPVLKVVATPYDTITDKDRQLARDMMETMYSDSGVGLAAPQVGVSKRLIVCAPEQERGQEYIFFNPVIKSKKGKCVGAEGCLSLPGISGDVERAEEIMFEGMDVNGEKIQKNVSGFFARIIQHEIDHLDGILFVDRVNLSDRQTLLNTYQSGDDLTDRETILKKYRNLDAPI
jgi:peptide deformylase